jgi:hypothetical protein
MSSAFNVKTRRHEAPHLAAEGVNRAGDPIGAPAALWPAENPWRSPTSRGPYRVLARAWSTQASQTKGGCALLTLRQY